MKRLDAEWQSMIHASGIQDAPAAQLREMKLAFYAGAAAFFGSIMGLLSPGLEPTEQDVQKLSELHQELLDFNAAVKRGEA